MTAAEKDPTIGKITLTPKRLSTHVDVSRALLVLGNPDVEELGQAIVIKGNQQRA